MIAALRTAASLLNNFLWALFFLRGVGFWGWFGFGVLLLPFVPLPCSVCNLGVTLQYWKEVDNPFKATLVFANSCLYISDKKTF